ncbi:MAG TPA: molybdenum cofactor guanylyltransferase [Pyrinomonadaceae bacterium]|jgi:molybdopterin-guanine dinucleotide biosynthesis protein A
MQDVEGFILVGGASSRMGEEKARLTLGGLSFVERIRGALDALTGRVTLVGSAERCAAWPRLPSVPDFYVEWGALGGLHAALTACRAEWAVVVACDLPFVTGELFTRLAALRENFDAVVPVQRDGRWQPLCALYRAREAGASAAELIAAGERRPRALLDQLRTRRVAFDDISSLRGADLFFTNVNTPEDYARAREKEGDQMMNDE